MIHNRPDPYPDELFPSICTRYLKQVHFSSRSSVIADLFGVEHSGEEYEPGMPENNPLQENEQMLATNNNNPQEAIDDSQLA